MASRWCAIISACQTSPTAMMLITTMQAAMTKLFCVSEAGTWRQRAIQAMVRGLLVLADCRGPTRKLPADVAKRRIITRATGGPVRDASRRGYRLRESMVCKSAPNCVIVLVTRPAQNERFNGTFFPVAPRPYRSRPQLFAPKRSLNRAQSL